MMPLTSAPSMPVWLPIPGLNLEGAACLLLRPLHGGMCTDLCASYKRHSTHWAKQALLIVRTFRPIQPQCSSTAMPVTA